MKYPTIKETNGLLDDLQIIYSDLVIGVKRDTLATKTYYIWVELLEEKLSKATIKSIQNGLAELKGSRVLINVDSLKEKHVRFATFFGFEQVGRSRNILIMERVF